MHSTVDHEAQRHVEQRTYVPDESERVGDWMQTYTGRKFWPLDPRPEDIDIIDIAHALSHMCRYGGHCRRFYSVAEHSLLIATKMTAPMDRLWALLHDAPEAYLVDVPRPIKPYLRGYASAEYSLMRAICKKYDMPYAMPEIVARADNAILVDEKAALMAPGLEWGGLPEKGLGVAPFATRLSPDAVSNLFLREFNDTMTALGRQA